tara:strand:+ start:991 stop:1368 length:378 start_codon:yes stop_codon:yes gene_type:complete
MEIYDFFGYLGGLILTLCLVPQIMKTYKTKKADDISTVWEYLYFIGVTFYIIYAIDKDLPPVYIPAFLELIFIIILFYLKRKYDRENKTKRQNLSNDNNLDDNLDDNVDDNLDDNVVINDNINEN